MSGVHMISGSASGIGATTVLVAVEGHAVVGRHHHRGVVVQVDRLELVEDLAHEPVGVGGLQQVSLPLQVLDPRHATVAAVDREVGPLRRSGVERTVGEVAPREVG